MSLANTTAAAALLLSSRYSWCSQFLRSFRSDYKRRGNDDQQDVSTKESRRRRRKTNSELRSYISHMDPYIESLNIPDAKEEEEENVEQLHKMWQKFTEEAQKASNKKTNSSSRFNSTFSQQQQEQQWFEQFEFHSNWTSDYETSTSYGGNSTNRNTNNTNSSNSTYNQHQQPRHPRWFSPWTDPTTRQQLQTLGLPTTADAPPTAEELKKAFHSAAMRHHPDRHQGVDREAAENRFKIAQAAYHSLLPLVEGR